jgi:ribulose-phosphate 3-epimerase
MTFHLEAITDPSAVIKEFQRLGVKPGISIKPGTPASKVLPYLKDVNVVLVMTVEPGFGGQSFMADMIPKIKEISAYIKSNKLSCKIEVDGGIDATTGKLCVEAGADVLVAGNSIFNSPNPTQAVHALKSI